MLIEVENVPAPEPIPFEKQIAREMYNLFIDHMKPTTQQISQLGYDLLSKKFGQVPETQRAAVFVRFKKELDDAGIAYDVSSFYQSEQAV